MKGLRDLKAVAPKDWDAAIISELEAAGIESAKFRDYDTPNSWLKHTMKGKLGEWTFSREHASYSFWGDVPLATAEAIAADITCVEGCIPRQWLPCWGEQPVARDVHSSFADNVVWIDVDGHFRVLDEGQSDEVKETLQQDASHKLRFVSQPSAEGKPFIQSYTFFTLDALRKFIEIAHRHHVDFTYTH